MAENSYSDISSAEERHSDMNNNQNKEILKIFDSAENESSFSGFESETQKEKVEAVKPKLKSVVKKVGVKSGAKSKGKAPQKKKTPGPVKKRKAVSTPKGTKSKKLKLPENLDSNVANLMVQFFENLKNIPSTSKSPVTAAAPAPQDVDNDEYQTDHYESESEFFDNDQEPQAEYVPEMGYSLFNEAEGGEKRIVISTNNSSIEVPKIYEDETKFSTAVTENLAEFVKSGCTRKADISSFLEANHVPSNCKSLIPPLVNPEVWGYLYPNIQQRDKSMQDIQKILGQSVVPMLKLATIFESNHIDVTEAKKLLTQAIALTCNSYFEMNIKRRYFIRPYVSKKFQMLCSSSYPIEEQLFPKDVAKRMKEISDASQINRQIARSSSYSNNTESGSKNYRGRSYKRGHHTGSYQNYRSRPYRRTRGSYRGRSRQ